MSINKKISDIKNIPLDKLKDADELIIIICGPVDCAKSTLLGVLSNPLLRKDIKQNLEKVLDNGNGKARKLITRFPHEIISGRTSSISYIPILFDKEHWLHLNKNRVITATDLCGHEKYLKTTVTGICSSYCDFGLVCIDRVTENINPMAKEHIKILNSLNIPFAIIITKIDIQTERELKNTIKKLTRYCSQKSNKKPLIIKNDNDVDIASNRNIYTSWLPFFLVSCKNGFGIIRLMKFLSIINSKEKNSKSISDIKIPDHPIFSVDSVFQVPGHGIVVSGYCGINISVGDKLLIGPYQKRDIFNFTEVFVRSIHDNYKNSIMNLEAGKRGCLCIRFLNQTDRAIYKKLIKPGMILALNEKEIPNISNEYKAEIHVFSGHHTTIKDGFNALCNIGNIKTSAIFKLINNNIARSGDIISVNLKFKFPICPLPNSEFIFREGISIGYGKILEPII